MMAPRGSAEKAGAIEGRAVRIAEGARGALDRRKGSALAREGAEGLAALAAEVAALAGLVAEEATDPAGWWYRLDQWGRPGATATGRHVQAQPPEEVARWVGPFATITEAGAAVEEAAEAWVEAATAWSEAHPGEAFLPEGLR